MSVVRVVVEPMPRASQQAVLDRSLTQRPALVWAPVVERAVAPLVVRDRQRVRADVAGRHPALVEFPGLEHLAPRNIAAAGVGRHVPAPWVARREAIEPGQRALLRVRRLLGIEPSPIEVDHPKRDEQVNVKSAPGKLAEANSLPNILVWLPTQ